MSEAPLQATIFADFTSPFCYVTEAGLAVVARTRPLEVREKAFELYPAPRPLLNSPPDARELEQVAPLAAELQLELRSPAFLPRTRKAHEAAHFARARGSGEPMRRALYAAYWKEGRDIGRIDVLMALAGEVGIDATELKIALDIDLHRDDVLADEEQARRLGVVRVPTLYLGKGAQARVLQGARSLAALDEAVRSS